MEREEKWNMQEDPVVYSVMVQPWNLAGEAGGKKLRGLSPQANYTDQATAACRRS
jgi:hypothetical protein